MSAECNTCGNDLVYGMGDMSDMFCPVCEREDVLVEMRRLGDQMQSEASRVAEWTRAIGNQVFMPYEVGSALHGLESAIHQWTELRRKGA